MTAASGGALLPVATPARVRRTVVDLIHPHRLLACFALLTLAGAAAVSLVAAPLLGRIVDIAAAAQSGSGDGSVMEPVLALVAVAVLQGALAVLGFVLVARLGEQVLATLREAFVDHALRLPLARIEQGGTGDLTSRVTEDVSVISDAVRSALPDFARSSLIIVLTVVGLTALDWRFGAAALLAVPVQVLTARWYLRSSGPIYAEERAVAGTEQQQLLDSIGGARTVRAFRLATTHLDAVRARVDASIDVAIRLLRLHTLFFGRLNLAELIGLTSVLVAGFLLVRSGTSTIGEASAAALYFANLFGPINAALFLLDKVQSATAGLARLVGVVDVEPPAEPAAPMRAADGAVKAVAVGHSYVEGHDVLHGVDLDVAHGAHVALVGASGAGKTTLAAILAGVRPPTRGTVHIGGVRLADQGQTLLRRTIALVTQEVHVFAGPLADDLRLAAPTATDEEIRAALETVDATGWVDLLPDGLGTVVGAGGHELSVVEAQQLALARLVLADPPVAILDEATAEAGSAGARRLEVSARAALRGRTGIVIAHRLTQAATADVVVVMHDGRVVEHGTHDELVAAGGHYSRLWEAWSASS
ncbi:ABC transporter ATP-binding protein [Pseudonocardia abyssalis]|uniref:ABC transporter ATP-binding protein n=1 Tax=Pseudonocardia abyssalis TaxID=2792008 RepID=A0ABS6UNX9_9PSEU|nr:ABC transporter ATP-binding protein [Pseudonocardia abyssalis]MBW0114799.1 ABC transporter ATP-binding protein [Pseudonocardia abyssalis]MBW0133957.1 ABC transporter ATP-binding protein [Pseudonocardia abyssalis]